MGMREAVAKRFSETWDERDRSPPRSLKNDFRYPLNIVSQRRSGNEGFVIRKTGLYSCSRNNETDAKSKFVVNMNDKLDEKKDHRAEDIPMHAANDRTLVNFYAFVSIHAPDIFHKSGDLGLQHHFPPSPGNPTVCVALVKRN
jgi:hypothetical protein